MSERLTQALSFANYRQTLNNQLSKLKIRAEGTLMFAKAGGNFSINQELICFVDYLCRTGLNEATLLDNNNTPVLITDVNAFLEEVTQRYFEVTNDYLREYTEIKKSRNIKKILDIKDDE